MSKEDTQCVINPWELCLEDRWKLYKFWLEEFSRVDFMEALMEIRFYDYSSLEVNKWERELDATVIENVDIIAMTTSGAARLRNKLKQIAPKIVIVEETAEIFEAHVLTSLTSSAEHSILIGDNFQLKPNLSVYHLGRDFGLDVSLFERMINNGIQCHTLDIQHRMRPEISSYLYHIYPSLKDHSSVYNYPKIRGVSKSVIFINHHERERVK